MHTPLKFEERHYKMSVYNYIGGGLLIYLSKKQKRYIDIITYLILGFT